MATMTESRALWSTMPGWGIVANLLPPEVIQSRRVRFVRRTVLLALTFVVLACVLGYGYVCLGHRSAEHDLAAEQARSQQLTIQQNRYSRTDTATWSGSKQIPSRCAHNWPPCWARTSTFRH
jgi:hypothetical protein